MELIWAVLGLSWVPVWQSWESLGFGRLRGHLGLSWGSPGPSRGPLGRLGRGLVGPSFFYKAPRAPECRPIVFYEGSRSLERDPSLFVEERVVAVRASGRDDALRRSTERLPGST